MFYFGNDLANNSQELETRRWERENYKVQNRPFLLPGGDSEWRLSSIDHDAAKRRFQQARERLEKTPW